MGLDQYWYRTKQKPTTVVYFQTPSNMEEKQKTY